MAVKYLRQFPEKVTLDNTDDFHINDNITNFDKRVTFATLQAEVLQAPATACNVGALTALSVSVLGNVSIFGSITSVAGVALTGSGNITGAGQISCNNINITGAGSITGLGSISMSGTITGATSISTGSLSMSGAITGATSISTGSLSMSGAITGVTSISMSSSITGVTSITASGEITGSFFNGGNYKGDVNSSDLGRQINENDVYDLLSSSVPINGDKVTVTGSIEIATNTLFIPSNGVRIDSNTIRLNGVSFNFTSSGSIANAVINCDNGSSSSIGDGVISI